MQYKSLERAIKILFAFKTDNREMGVVELSRLLDLHRSTVSRITRVLADYDFLERNPETKRFSLGQANIRLASSLKQSLRTNMVQIAKPFVDDLRNRFETTTIIEALVGRSWVMTYVAEGPRPIQLAVEVGERMPIHAAAGGKAFLAFSPPDFSRRMLSEPLPRLTKNTITDPNKLTHHFYEIRHQGFSFDKGEYTARIHAIAAPIFNYQNKPVASLVVTDQAERIAPVLDDSKISALKEAAHNVSQRLGFREMEYPAGRLAQR